MNQEDTEKLLLMTHCALRREFGMMNDFPYEFANMVANVFFRYIQQTFASAPPLSPLELAIRDADYRTIVPLVSEIRALFGSPEIEQWHIDMMISCSIDMFRYRMKDAPIKNAIRRKIERIALKDHDMPNLARDLSLHD